MSDDNSASNTPPSPSARRSSFSSGQRLSGLFGRSPTNGNAMSGVYPGPISTAAAQAQAQQRRRTSISSLGLAGSPTQSAFASARARQSSVSSGGTNNTIDESAIEDGDAGPLSASPTSAYGRRLSFGAEALRKARAGNTGNGEGFNWSEQLRSRAERSSSLSSPPSSAPAAYAREPPKSASMAAPEQPVKLPPSPRVPDHFQERILKGDFYMD